jgi:two-component system alkaline phosphatase synthesis response regulator PhoP
LAQTEKPTLLVLDLMLPGMDGLTIAQRLRASHDPALASIYIMMLTARIEEADRIAGLELGGDDYISKPFSPRELVARVRAALRRLENQSATGAAGVVARGALQLDPTYRSVTLDGAPLDLTAVEFDLLHHLMRHPNRPFTRAELLDVTQPEDPTANVAYDRTIDAHIKNLRQKLGAAGRESRFIETVHGVGYRFIG